MNTPDKTPRSFWRAFIAPRLSLSSAILVTVIGFALVLTGVIGLSAISGSRTVGQDMAAKTLDLTGELIKQQTANFCQPVAWTRDTLAALPEIATRPKGFDHPLLGLFLDAMASMPQLYSLHVTYQDGSYYQGISFRGRPALYDELQAPPQAMYGIRHISILEGAPMQAWRFYDAKRQVIQETPLTRSAYTPRSRDWYTGAVASGGVFCTEPYVFTSLQNLGVTTSRLVPGPEPVVIALGVTLASLSDFVAERRMGEAGLVYMFSASGQLIAYPDAARVIGRGKAPDGAKTLRPVQADTLDVPLVRAIGQAFQDEGGKPFAGKQLHVADTDFLVKVLPVPLLGGEAVNVALAVPASEIIGTLEASQRRGLLLAAVLMALAVPVMIVAARAIAGPLGRLTDEAVRISELDLTEQPAVFSRISEVETLCRAMAVMKTNFQVFGRYLPRSLMRHLHGGALSTLGGERREITLLFTDVEDFTSLSEHTAPEELMQTMSEYFQGVTKAITDTNGTIDKFIGDAVMAFWNAPQQDDAHVGLACAAALRLQKATDAFNAGRRAQGLPQLRTRVGIHTGEAVVGNIGTDDRMDYTALGSVVNLTSRLEALNKYYGTRILVSKRVRDAVARSFLFRSSDVVAPKGVSEAQATFELLGAKPRSDYPDVAVSSQLLGYCSRWERAMTLYRTQQWDKALAEFTALAADRPEDSLAKRYVHRVDRLLAGGEVEEWKPAVHFTEK